MDIFADVHFSNSEDSLEKSNLISSLKIANTKPVFIKDDIDSKERYKPASIFPNVSKII